MIRTNLRVGPAGYPTIKIADFMELIDSCQAQGFSALELEFVRITSSEYPSSDTMKQLAGYAKKRGVGLSIHGSFYINLAAIEEKKITLAKEFLKQGIRVAEAATQVMGRGGKRQVPDVEKALAMGFGGSLRTELMILGKERLR